MNQAAANRILPNNVDAEQAVLSALFLDNGRFEDIEDLAPECFYKPAHGLIFDAMLCLRKKNEPVDLVTVAQELKATGSLKPSGGASYLAKIADQAPAAVNVGHYAGVIRDAATVREAIRAGFRIAEMGFSAGSVEDYISTAQAEILKIQTTGARDRAFTMQSLMLDAVSRIEDAQTRDRDIGLRLGMPKLDNYMQVFGSKLILIAARTAVGKTALALSIARFLARQGTPVGYLSIEMDKETLADRLLGAEADINPQCFYTKGMLRTEDYSVLNEAAVRISDLPVFVDDSECMIQDVERKCRKMKKQGCRVIFIDQLSKIRGRAGQQKYEMYTDHCAAIALLKKELRIPIFLLCQVNREVEQRADKRPALTDLKQTGMLEEDADMVLFIYRPGCYDQNIDASRTEIILAKNRQGSTGVEQQVLFNKRRGMFRMKG